MSDSPFDLEIAVVLTIEQAESIVGASARTLSRDAQAGDVDPILQPAVERMAEQVHPNGAIAFEALMRSLEES